MEGSITRRGKGRMLLRVALDDDLGSPLGSAAPAGHHRRGGRDPGRASKYGRTGGGGRAIVVPAAEHEPGAATAPFSEEGGGGLFASEVGGGGGGGNSEELEELDETEGGRGESDAAAPFVVVFDFDKTLAVRHVGQFDVNSSVEERCFGGAGRVESLRRLFDDIRGRGGRIHICTRNSSHIVEKSLAVPCRRGQWGPNMGGVGLMPSVSSIVGLERMDWETPKSAAIKRFLSRGTPPQRILFVDDDASNIGEVADNLPGCGLLHVKGRGMNAEDIDYVRNWAAEAAATAAGVSGGNGSGGEDQ